MILDYNQELSNEILNFQNDFFDYITGNFESLTESQQDELFLHSIDLSPITDDNRLMDLIIQKKVEKEIPEYRIGTQDVNTELVKNTYLFLIV